MSDENITAPNTSNYNFNPQLSFFDTKTKVEFKGSCLKQDKITYDHGKVVNIYIVYEISRNSNISNYPTLENCIFGAVSLAKNANIDKYKYSGYGIGFDRGGVYLLPSGNFGRNVIISGVDMSSSVHVDNKGKDILILGKGPTQGLGEHSLTAEKMYSINFTVTKKKFCLSLHYNGANSYLFVNGTEIHKFKAKNSDIVATPLCIGNISKDWSVDNMKKTGLNGHVYDFSVDYNVTAVDDILDIHKHLMKKNNIKLFKTIKKVFLEPMSFLMELHFNCNALKCVSMNNQGCKIRPEIISINSSEPFFFYP